MFVSHQAHQGSGQSSGIHDVLYSSVHCTDLPLTSITPLLRFKTCLCRTGKAIIQILEGWRSKFASQQHTHYYGINMLQ